MNKFLPLILWYPISLAALVFMLLFYSSINYKLAPSQVAGVNTTATIVNAAGNVAEQIPILPPFESSLIAADARPKIISAFLETYSCPLKPYDYYADKFVEAADRHNLDFRLLPAIAMQESNCCKKIPGGSYNCWGFGIYGDQVVVFPSYEAGIDTVAKTLSKKYSSKGLLEPDEIMRKYTPSSKGSWAAGVLHFMNEMK